jgi:CheY-like chemotaxis protein
MQGKVSYRLLVVEDQGLTAEGIRAALAVDRSLDKEGEPYLELDYLASNRDDALQYLELERLPDAIILDDYLPEGMIAQSSCLEVMSYLLQRCQKEEIPQEEWPRAVLWTSGTPKLAYTFCVLGGLQYRDKRSIGGQKLPIENVWAALAGQRWRPEPYPDGLIESRRAALPWLEAGWEIAEVVTEPSLASSGVTRETLNEARVDIQNMPRSPDLFSPEFPRRWGGRMFRALEDNGWVWVPLDSHDKIPAGAPLPLVIDPAVHRESLPPYGPLPTRIAARFQVF